MRGVSIRKLLKLPTLSDSDRDYLQAELDDAKYRRKDRTDKCPICGEELYHRSWSEDHWGVVETITQCGYNFMNTHYKDHFSYGETELIAGNFEASYTYKTPWIEVDWIRAEWMEVASRLKNQYKRNRKLAYRKAKSQQRRMKRA